MTEKARSGGTRIVIIDDDGAARHSLEQMLRLRSYDVKSFGSAEEALKWPRLNASACLITDVKMPGMDGEEFLSLYLSRGSPAPVIMITGHGDVSMAVRCLKAGAYDFVEKPFDDSILIASVERAVEKADLRRESLRLRRRLSMLSAEQDGRFGLIGRSSPMQNLYEQITTVARADAPVLIVGETGVGKELVARAIHDQSSRCKGPFVPINAGGLPEAMLESELFGHARGAYTGALLRREGKLVAASGGTLLLDEIESISVQAQVKLLRVLEDGLVQPLGTDTPTAVDVRILATSKANLSEEVRCGRMREDFYHRIMVLQVDVPPLRKRRDDVPLLVMRFLKDAAERNRAAVPQIPESVLSAMMDCPWPGNVRELKNVVERMVITARGGKVEHFHSDGTASPPLLSLPSKPGTLRDALEATERRVIRKVLGETGGEIAAAYRALGISRKALYERMKRYGFQKEDFRKV